MALLIRRVAEKDIDGLLAIGREVPEFAVSKLGTFWSKEQLLLWSKSKDDLMLIAVQEEKIIGFAFFAVHKPTSKATFENLWVHPDYRHEKVARRLMEVSSHELELLGVTYIAALIADHNKAIMKFLEANGFVIGEKVIWIDKMV
jgi:ribosomal protein S18 acetylase RimI-like enzyme